MGYIPPIKRYKDDESLSWEERYERLMAHHEQETIYLCAVIDMAKDSLDYDLTQGRFARFFKNRHCDRILWRANMATWKVLAGLDKPYDPEPDKPDE